MAFKKILVAVDFSDASRKALKVADEIAYESESRLTIMHVVPTAGIAVMELSFVLPADELNRWAMQAEEQLTRWSKELRLPRSRVALEAMSGDPVAQIEEASRTHDLVVVGTHGRRGISRFLLGSVAERVARAAHCSVLLVRDAEVDGP